MHVTLVTVVALGLVAASSAAAKPKPCKTSQHRVHGKCVAKPKPDPTKLWAPKVEAFYQDELAAIRNLATVAGNFGHLQPGDLQTAITGVGQCEANLARDTGVTPTTAKAQSAMTQLHQVCSLMVRAAGEIQQGAANLDASQIAAATTDLQSAVSLLKAIVTSLGQPT